MRSVGGHLRLIDLHELESINQQLRELATARVQPATTDEHQTPDRVRHGLEGEGFRRIIGGWNAERIQVASEAIGAAAGSSIVPAPMPPVRLCSVARSVLTRGIQLPIAQAHASIAAAALVRDKAAWLFDAGRPCGPEANKAKLLASQASWAAANACLDTLGGWGSARAYDVERKFRETRLLSVAPIGNKLVLAYLGHNVLGMPRSY